MRRGKHSIILGWTLTLLVILVCFSPQFRSLTSLPRELRLTEGANHALSIDLPFGLWITADTPGNISINGDEIGKKAHKLSFASPLSLEPLQQGTVELKLSLFGLTLRKLSLEIVPSINLAPAGNSIGVTLQSDGAMIVGFATVRTNSSSSSPGRDAGLQLGDRIVTMNDVDRPGIEEIGRLVDEAGKRGEPVLLRVIRGGTQLELYIRPLLCRETNRYRLGLYVRDDAVGIGTMTFVDHESRTYGALGHVITDMDTGQAVEVGSGKIVRAVVTSIEAGKKGTPGEKRSIFIDEHRVIGNILKNTQFGIFGDVLDELVVQNDALPIRLKDQIQEGPVTILTVIDGQKIEEFSAEIQRVSRQQYSPAGKGLIIKITDPRLLEQTGGIVQGMSGSPIIQDGHLIGAVTHVFVNDPTRGYGVFIEWMVRESELLEKRLESAPTFFYRKYLRVS